MKCPYCKEEILTGIDLTNEIRMKETNYDRLRLQVKVESKPILGKILIISCPHCDTILKMMR